MARFNGSASAPTYSFASTGNGDNGMYLAASNAVGIAAAGALVAKFNSSGVTASGSVLIDSATGGLGYATGSGGSVTQTTSKSTAVTLNKPVGQITMDAAALAANTAVSFTLTNSMIAGADLLLLNVVTGTAGAYTVSGSPATGSATITLRNVTGASLSEGVLIYFAVIKGVNS